MKDNHQRPFGPPIVRTRALVTTLRRAECAPPIALWRSLRREGGYPGLCLFESAGADGSHSTIRHSVLVTRALLRLEACSGTVSLTPLVEGAQRLLEGLSEQLEYETEATDTYDDDATLKARSVLDVLRRVAGAVVDEKKTPLAPGLFGAFSYDFVDHFESLPERRPDYFDDPELSFVLGTDMVIEDHLRGDCTVITRGMPWENSLEVKERHGEMVRRLQEVEALSENFQLPAGELPTAHSDLDEGAFMEGVERFRDEIGRGEIFQGVFSRGMTVESTVDSAEVYRALRFRNPSPYLFHLDLGRGELLGASPELFLRVEDGFAEIRPIAGTAARGRDADGGIDEDLDRRLALELQLDPKEQAEHVMLLDLARNDIARVSVPGTMRVVEQFVIEPYSHVQHLVSRVRGKLRTGLDALHCYRAVANMGTLTGAPKVRAMELIRETECRGRGFYGGAAGYLLSDGNMETCIVIRSLRVKDGHYRCQAGAGVVWDSDPRSEYEETHRKAYACLEAVAIAERSER